MMRALVSGSVAFDFIMHFPGRFAEHLDVGNRHGVSVAFTTPTMRRAFGGCAGNIAYGLRALGDAPVLAATAGGDFAPYRARLEGLGIATAGLREYPDAFTAQAYIVTDDENSQITLFHPGAMNFAHEIDVVALAEGEGDEGDGVGVEIAMVSPNGREGMLAHMEALAERGVCVVLDVGQATGLFEGGELRRMMGWADYAIFNRHEFELTAKAAGLDEREAAEMVRGLVITDGERGSRAVVEGEAYEARALVLGATRDPTGCGDAFRAGMLHGMMRGWGWRDILDFSALIAGVKAQSSGGQEYEVSAESARRLFRKCFGREVG